ncbi:MAG: helix-turn-helix transcriptional regulator [Liquorilactobacillus ghanensis]|uniref:helix-turn-helix domain-containing protein n=1 Tax=Liquorilactobacillus ghanensis TaxID=399370 RepID=UPI0039ECE08B
MKFGDRLKNARTKMNLTQEQVANVFFITRQTISSWENEKTYPDIASLIKLSDYYHISLDTLLKEDTGMREYLEKKEVKKNLRPIYSDITFVMILILLFLISGGIKFIKLSYLVTPLLLLIELFLGIILVRLKEFDKAYSLEIKYKWQKYTSGENGIKYGLILPGIIIISGAIFFLLKQTSIATSLIIIGLTLLFLMLKRNRI